MAAASYRRDIITFPICNDGDDLVGRCVGSGVSGAHGLRAAGVDVTYTEYPGMTHGFNGSFGLIDAAREACDEASRRILTSFTQ